MDNSGDHPLLIVGASARAAACSALRGGLAPQAADLFADADLASLCRVVQVADYPHGLPAAAASFPAGPWMYVGGLENHPRIIAEISAQRTLWGNGPEAVRAVRDPLRWTAELLHAGLAAPRVAGSPADLPTDGSWLRKPRRSAGGANIEPLLGDEVRKLGIAEHDPARWYFQERIAGEARAGVFLAAGGQAQLWGVTEQLIGLGWLNARPFHYCGSVGPLALSTAELQQWRRAGDILAARFDLVGLFGVDAIVVDAGSSAATVYPVEINPRYSASVEVLERVAAGSAGISAVGLHAQACRDGRLPTELTSASFARSRPGSLQGKAIVFAPHQVLFDEQAAATAAAHGCADVPQIGSRIPAGWPVLTCFAQAAGREEVLRSLVDQAGHWRQILDSLRDQ